MSIQIVIDSTAYLSNEYIKEHNIEVAHLSVELDEHREREGFMGSFKDFFERFENSKDFPKTSQPPVGEFVECFERLLKRGTEVLVVTFSSKLSGTYCSAVMASEMFDEGIVSVIDSETAVANYRQMIYKAVEMSKNGMDKKDIISEIESMKDNMSINLTVDSLEYLKRGGRLSNMQAIIGTLLNIKPIISLTGGELLATDKVRGKKKALDNMISKIPKGVKTIGVDHVENLAEAEKVKAMLEEKFSNADITIGEIGPVIGAHLGPKSLGICCMW